ncbi:MAG: hypothetical protein HYV01_23005 [Deltaproteobacteria bacterium]|nr:hypothetical protein [Deltaproteobacteria bacterium]
MLIKGKAANGLVAIAASALLAGTLVAGCAGGALTTREKGAGIGALGGAAAGGIIGSAVRHPGAGAAIGGLLGLGAGALIGDQLQGCSGWAPGRSSAINSRGAKIRPHSRINRSSEIS